MQAAVRARPGDRAEELRLELYEKVNALGIGAQGLGGLTTVLDVKINDYPTHAASKPVALLPNCAATRHAHFVLDGSGPAKLDPPSLDDWPALTWTSRRAARVILDTLTEAEIAGMAAGRAAAALGQAPDRPRCRAPAHRPRCIARGEPLPVDFANRFIYYVGSGRPGARRGRRPRGPDDVVAHGQVHRHDAREDRPDRHDRQVRARPGGDRGYQRARRRLLHRGRRRGLSGVEGHQGVARAGVRGPRHGSDLRVRGEGHAGHRGRRRARQSPCTRPGRRSGGRGSARSR